MVSERAVRPAQRYRDRREAGRFLAEQLREHAGRDDVVVLALPRGGVPVGYEVAKALAAPLDVFTVRKLGVPGNPELAMGAIATGGLVVLDQRLIQLLGIDRSLVQRTVEAESRELQRREAAFPHLTLAHRFRQGREDRPHGARGLIVRKRNYARPGA